ncbi:MAG: hypothetical protein RR853_09080, partial [Aurantimicrobium sp.]|uniref:hypothetical protein n=1 Tax=Aurantimicrobium sp. TaxID=1930784 RepID=UPI002FCAD8C3
PRSSSTRPTSLPDRGCPVKNAQLRIRAIPDAVLETILEMIREEAKDVRCDAWDTNEAPGYVPRGSYPERPPARGGRGTQVRSSW